MFAELFAKVGISEPAYFWPPNTVPMLMLSIGVFGLFLNLDIPHNKTINAIASTTFGVYLLHDGALCYYIWRNVFKVAEVQGSVNMVAYILGVSFVVFIAATIIDYLYVLIERACQKTLKTKKEV